MLSALAAVPSILLIWYWRDKHKRNEIINAREGQLTDRYTKAIEQMGSKGLGVRLGGIYALERISKDSERDHWTIVETLSAFIRENSSIPQKGDPTTTSVAGQERDKPTTDIQAALTVLGRRKWRESESEHLDLHETNLRNAHLLNADFTHTYLHKTNLENAYLGRAILRDSYLVKANLSEAYLYNANLEEALLDNANLKRADLRKAEVSNAMLENVDLEEANLEKATLTRANLKKANLRKAILKEANLEDAYLVDAVLEDADLSKSNLRSVILNRANLKRANLEEASVGDRHHTTSMEKVDFTEANLQKAILEGVLFDHSIMCGANLTGAKLSRALLGEVDLQEAILLNLA